MAEATDARVHVYYGRDDFRLRDAYRSLHAALDHDGMLATNTTLLVGRGLSVQELVQHVATIPFLADSRVVVVEGLITSLGGGQGVVREWQPLLDALEQLPPTNHLVLLEPLDRQRSGTFGRSNLFGELKEVPDVDVQDFPLLRSWSRGNDDSELVAWARERSASAGVEFERAAIAELAELVGDDLWLFASEIEKLGLYASRRAVTIDDVRALTPEAREAGIFDLVDAVVEGRAAPALLLIRRMLEQGSEPPGRIQVMIARQLRHLIRATELLELGGTPEEIGKATNVRSNFPLTKLVRQARATTREAAEAALREIEASDHRVKTGQTDEVLALELLVMRLTSITRRRPAAAL